MVEVGMGVENVANGESELMQFMENSFVRSTGIDHDRLFCYRISNDRTITTEGWNGEGFSNHRRHDGRMLPSTPIEAQAPALHLAGCRKSPPAAFSHRSDPQRTSTGRHGAFTRCGLARKKARLGALVLGG